MTKEISNEEQRKIFSENLNYYMELKDKTQIDLINDLGFNKSTVSTWCNGSKMPYMGTIQKLADYFNIQKTDLIDIRSRDNDKSNLRMLMYFLEANPDYEELVTLLRDVKPDDIDFIKTMLLKFKDKN